MSPSQRPPADSSKNRKQLGASQASSPEPLSTTDILGSRSIVTLVVVALLAYIYLASQSSKTVSDSLDALSQPYALCSRDGDNIYTVDGLNSRTQCIVVHGAFIVDTGVIGKSSQSTSNRSLIPYRRCSEALARITFIGYCLTPTTPGRSIY